MKRILFFLAALACLAACQSDGSRKAKHVIVIGIDGWGSEGMRVAPAADLPNFHELMDHGAWTLAKRAVMPSASAINWASIFNGLPTEMHGFDKWNSTHGTIPSTADNGHGIPPTVFTILREQRPGAESGCLYDWDGVGPVADTLAMSYNHYIKTYSGDEVFVSTEDYTQMAIDYILDKKPDLFVFYYGSLDSAGHDHGWCGPEYMAKQREIDKGVGMILRALKDAGMDDDTIVVVTSDHGGTGRGHGNLTMQELETPLLVYGPGIKQGYEITAPVMQYDTAAIVADLLGLKIPADWRGRPFPEIYK